MVLPDVLRDLQDFGAASAIFKRSKYPMLKILSCCHRVLSLMSFEGYGNLTYRQVFSPNAIAAFAAVSLSLN